MLRAGNMANPLLTGVFAAAMVAVGNASAAPVERPLLFIPRMAMNCDIRTPSKLNPDDVASVLTDFLKAAPFNLPQVTKSRFDDSMFGAMAILLSWDAPPLPGVIDSVEIMALDLELSGNISLSQSNHSAVTTKNGNAVLSKDYVLSIEALFPQNLASSGQPPKVLNKNEVVVDLKTRLAKEWPNVTCQIPPDAKVASAQKATQYLSEVRLFASGYCPKDWAAAAGQLLPVGENRQLFKLLGTTYGGDGKQNFGLPNFSKQPPAGTGENKRGPIWCIATSGLDLQKAANGN